MKHKLQLLMAVLAAVVGVGVAVPASPASANFGGCASHLYSATEARGSCTTLNGGDFIREYARCQNYITGGYSTAYGAAVYEPYTSSKARCPSGTAVVRHWLQVWDA